MGPKSRLHTCMALGILLFFPQSGFSYGHSLLAEPGPTINVDSLFHHTASRNQKVITQAVDFVLSMQTAPTCTRMAASHLMSECKLLEHAPEFAKSRPEAYLDNVKTEYAAKLAVCELLSAQPNNPVPPPNCDILVPSTKACGRSLNWWYTKSESPNDKQCYPEFKDYQYAQCLKSLQSTPQFWTSFSNARQNAVVMCQASRDAIERENHLETFKNMTQILGVVTSRMHETTEGYESLIHEQRRFTEESRDAHHQLKEDIGAIQLKAVATVASLEQKFHAFMETSISELITALGTSQNTEIARIHQKMQNFSQDLILENTQLAHNFASELRKIHQISLATLQNHHDAQIGSYTILSNHADAVYSTLNRTNNIAGISLAKADSMARRLQSLESQTENIAEGFRFLNAIPTLISRLIRGVTKIIGVIFAFTLLFKIDKTLATYTAGACSSIFLLYSSSIVEWIINTSFNKPMWVFGSTDAGPNNLWSTQLSASMTLLLWFSSYPIYHINQFLGHRIVSAFDCILRPLYINQFVNEGGKGLLPSIEIPRNSSSTYPDTASTAIL